MRSLDYIQDLLDARKSFVEVVEGLTQAYKGCAMTKAELLEELQDQINGEWARVEATK